LEEEVLIEALQTLAFAVLRLPAALALAILGIYLDLPNILCCNKISVAEINMKYTTLVATALASIASAHSDPRDVHAGIPKMLGGRKFLAELRAKNALPAPLMMERREEKREPDVQVMRSVEDLEERQISTNGECGPGLGHCPAGQCCSIEG
jgi:hypothetical protein